MVLLNQNDQTEANPRWGWTCGCVRPPINALERIRTMVPQLNSNLITN